MLGLQIKVKFARKVLESGSLYSYPGAATFYIHAQKNDLAAVEVPTLPVTLSVR